MIEQIGYMVMMYQSMRMQGKVLNEFEHQLYEQLCCMLTVKCEYDREQIKQALEGMRNKTDEDQRPEESNAH